MASVFRRTIRGKKSKVWYFKFKDRTGGWCVHRGWPNREDTLAHALAVEAEHGAVRRGEKPAPSHWSKGHLRPLPELIEGYMRWGRERGGRRGLPWPEPNARKRERYLRWWATTLSWHVLGDIGRAGVEQEVDGLLAAGHYARKSIALRVEAIQAFVSWTVGRGFLPSNPLVGLLGHMDVRAQKPHRPLTTEEIAALMEKAPPLRRLWYATALETGYRVGELRALTVGSLDPTAPCLNLAGQHTKDRKPARQFIGTDLCAALLPLAAGKAPDAPLLGIPASKAWSMFKADAKAAEIVALTTEGKASWHSLRKSFVNAVVAAGADLKTSMTLARHSTADLTMHTYATADDGRVRAAAGAAAERLRPAAKPGCGTPVVISPQVAETADDASACAAEPSGELAMVGASGLEPPEAPDQAKDKPTLKWSQTGESGHSVLLRVGHARPSKTHPAPIPDRSLWYTGGNTPAIVERLAVEAGAVAAALVEEAVGCW
jgi:integrase